MTHLFDLFEYETIPTSQGPMRWPGYKEEIGVTPGVRECGVYNSPEENALLQEWCKDARFVDVGAHVGWFSLLAHHAGAFSVIAIEPSPTNFSMLAWNLAGINATCYQAAAWDKTEMLDLSLSWHNSGDHRVFDHDDDQPVKGLKVIGMPLDDIVPLANVVKIDAQGTDHRVLMGMKELIRICKPKILCEFSPHHIKSLGDDPEQVLDYIFTLDYNIDYLGHDYQYALDTMTDCTFLLT